jgi:hypothetical protein
MEDEELLAAVNWQLGVCGARAMQSINPLPERALRPSSVARGSAPTATPACTRPEDQWSPQRHGHGYDKLRWVWLALLASPVLAFLGLVLLVFLALATDR